MRHRSLAAAAATFALLGTTLAAAPPAASSGGFDPSVFAKKGDRTPFAFKSATYGSRVRGGQIPASSGTTSYQAIGCTNVVGVDKTNVVASVEIPGLGTAKGVSTRNWTERSNGVHSSFATHDITKIVLSESSFGELALKGLSSFSRAYHDATGFHATTKTQIASLTFTPTDGSPQELALPTPGSPIIIPGLVEIRSGSEKTRVDGNGAKARADVLDVTLIPTDTRVRVAHTGAKLNRGVKRGLFAGFSAATQVRALNDLVQSGPQPHTRMPCQGTMGKEKGKDIASVDLSPLLQVGAASTRQMGQQRPGKANGYELARVASVDLGNGQLVITGIQGRVNVARTRDGVTFDTDGTKFLTATANGTEYSFPELDGLTIPGLVQIETGVTKEFKSGVEVIAVRLTLLDGSGAVVDLGHAKLLIAGSGLK
ncbi:choice-of-anchor P family protein [Nocardioides dilutus]